MGQGVSEERPEYYTLVCNGTTLVIWGDEFRDGDVTSAFGHDEQCEDCGADLLMSSEPGDEQIVCECGASYELKPAFMRNDRVIDY